VTPVAAVYSTRRWPSWFLKFPVSIRTWDISQWNSWCLYDRRLS